MSNDNSEENICDKCRKKFFSKYTLASHKKKSRTCKEVVIDEKYTCEYCSRELSTINNLNRHELICPEKQKKDEKEKLENIEKNIKKMELDTSSQKTKIKELELELSIQKTNTEKIEKELHYKDKFFEIIKTQLEKELHYKDRQLEDKNKQIQDLLEDKNTQIQDLQDKLQDLAKMAIDKKSTSNTTTTNIIHGGDLTLYMNKEEIHETIMAKLTKDNIYTGFNGVAKFVGNYIAKVNGKQVYFCVDVSRLNFSFNDSKGNEIKDPKATKILNMLKPSIEEKLYKIREEENAECERLKTLSPANQERIDKLPMCEFTLDKISKLTFEVFDMLNNNKMASEMAKFLT